MPGAPSAPAENILKCAQNTAKYPQNVPKCGQFSLSKFVPFRASMKIANVRFRLQRLE